MQRIHLSIELQGIMNFYQAHGSIMKIPVFLGEVTQYRFLDHLFQYSLRDSLYILISKMGCTTSSATQAELQRGDVIVPIEAEKKPKNSRELIPIDHHDPLPAQHREEFGELENQLDQTVNRPLLQEEYTLLRMQRGIRVFQSLNKDIVKEYVRLEKSSKEGVAQDLASLVVFKNEGRHKPDVLAFLTFHIEKIGEIKVRNESRRSIRDYRKTYMALATGCGLACAANFVESDYQVSEIWLTHSLIALIWIVTELFFCKHRK